MNQQNHSNRFLRACRRQPVDATPVWFMRQAGRYMAEYRALREKHSLLELCQTPELAAEITLQPLHRIEVDAAILFSDLLLPLAPMGLPFEFVHGEGPVVHTPLRTQEDIDRLRPLDPRADLPFVLEAVRLVKQELDSTLPLIGFAGAPFTLASYAVEGGPSKTFARTKALMYTAPEAWHQLCSKLADAASALLDAQISAGVDAVQLFDSWVGQLSARDYREFALPHTRRVFDALGGRVPTIHFGTGTSALLETMRDAGGDVIGVDWRVPLDEAWMRIGFDRAVQGNLDPTLLLGSRWRIREGAEDVLQRAAGRPGHIFNLGHGILPTTPPEHVQMLARFVHEASSREALDP
ncbi:MAG: uroporphyrinogen decarboxylase [Luteitalea sp.]|nr:uroporphyrinogen decarboxylase [Luteitalea sp.]